MGELLEKERVLDNVCYAETPNDLAIIHSLLFEAFEPDDEMLQNASLLLQQSLPAHCHDDELFGVDEPSPEQIERFNQDKLIAPFALYGSHLLEVVRQYHVECSKQRGGHDYIYREEGARILGIVNPEYSGEPFVPRRKYVNGVAA